MTDVPADKPIKPAGPFSAWEIGLAIRYLRAKRKEGGVALIAIISFLGIMLAVTVLISVLSIMSGFRAELMGRILDFNGHMYVQGQVLRAEDRDQVIERIRAIPGISEAAPLIEAQAPVAARGQVSGVIVRGVRPQDLRAMGKIAESIDKKALASFGTGEWGGNEIIIGKGLADQLAVRPGDVITLYSITGSTSAFGNLGPMEKTYTVGGVFTAGMADYDRAFIFMPLEQAQLFFGKEGVWDVVEIKLDDPDQVEAFAPRIREAAGRNAFITDWRDRNAAFWNALGVERIAMSLILGLVVLIAALNIISGIVMLVKNKGRDIAILRTMGASQSSILRVFFTAGALIGIGGTIAGLILGVLFCLNIESIQAFIENLTGASVFNSEIYVLPRVPAKIDPTEVMFVALFAFAASCLATFPPAWRASRIDPVEALRYE